MIYYPYRWDDEEEEYDENTYSCYFCHGTGLVCLSAPFFRCSVCGGLGRLFYPLPLPLDE